jgi:hypothetical protein
MKIRIVVPRGTETTIEEVAIRQKNCMGNIFKVYNKNESKCWTELYKYVKRRKGNKENIPTIKDGNGRLITDSTEKASSFNYYYSSIFRCEHRETVTLKV